MKTSIVAGAVGTVALVASAGALASGGSGPAGGTSWQGKATARIIAAEHAGKISQAQGDAMLARIQAGHRPGGNLRRVAFREAASSLGMSRLALRAELRSGKSLAQVLGEHNIPVGIFEQAVIAKVTAQVDARPSIAPANRQAIVAKLQTRLDKLVNHVFSAATAG